MSTFNVRSPGHEGAGVVVKIGSNVKNFKLGDRAGIKPLIDVCQRCETCWGGNENHCANGVYAGLQVPGKGFLERWGIMLISDRTKQELTSNT
jgi:alcohol dehydrogenase, propanol-preferring